MNIQIETLKGKSKILGSIITQRMIAGHPETRKYPVT